MTPEKTLRNSILEHIITIIALLAFGFCMILFFHPNTLWLGFVGMLVSIAGFAWAMYIAPKHAYEIKCAKKWKRLGRPMNATSQFDSAKQWVLFEIGTVEEFPMTDGECRAIARSAKENHASTIETLLLPLARKTTVAIGKRDRERELIKQLELECLEDGLSLQEVVKKRKESQHKITTMQANESKLSTKAAQLCQQFGQKADLLQSITFYDDTVTGRSKCTLLPFHGEKISIAKGVEQRHATTLWKPNDLRVYLVERYGMIDPNAPPPTIHAASKSWPPRPGKLPPPPGKPQPETTG